MFLLLPLLCRFSCVQLFVTLWTVTLQAPLSMGFSRQKYLSGLPYPPPGDLPDPGIELGSPALQANSLSLSHQGSLLFSLSKLYSLPSTWDYCSSCISVECEEITFGPHVMLTWKNHYSNKKEKWPFLQCSNPCCCSLFSYQIISDPSWPHGLQYARPSCPSLYPRVCPSSCPLYRWCHPTISSSVTLFCLRSLPASEFFPMCWLFILGGQSIEVSVFRVDFLWDWLVWSSCCPRDSQEASPAPQLENINYLGFPDSSVGKESTCNAGDPGLIPGSGRSPGEGKGYPLQYSGLENSMDWIVHGVSKSRARLSDFHFHCLLYENIFAMCN